MEGLAATFYTVSPPLDDCGKASPLPSPLSLSPCILGAGRVKQPRTGRKEQLALGKEAQAEAWE